MQMRHSDRWEKRIIRDSKRYDLLKGIYDSLNLVDTEFLLSLNRKQQSKCFYCDIPMAQHYRKKRNGLTLERLNVALGHIKSNCVLCCKSCNSKRLHRDIELIKRMHSKWSNFQPETERERRPCMA